jgi:hypothetical protein
MPQKIMFAAQVRGWGPAYAHAANMTGENRVVESRFQHFLRADHRTLMIQKAATTFQL